MLGIFVDRFIDPEHHNRHAARVVPTHLHERDVDVGIAQARAHRADAAGPVVVLQHEQVRDVLHFNI